MLERLIDKGCEKVVFAIFDKACDRAMENVHTPVFEDME